MRGEERRGVGWRERKSGTWESIKAHESAMRGDNGAGSYRTPMFICRPELSKKADKKQATGALIQRRTKVLTGDR